MNPPARSIINTVGASAIFNLRNVARSNQLSPEINLTALENQLKSSDGREAAIESLSAIMQQHYSDAANARLIPAEISSLAAVQPGLPDKLYFIVGTATDGQIDLGEICGEALSRYYLAQGYAVELLPVLGFTVHKSSREMPQPEIFLDVLNRLVVRIQKNRPDIPILINLTGGYKLGGIYAALIGLLHGCEIYYLHEEMRQPIGLPAISSQQVARLGEIGQNIEPEEYAQLDAKLQLLYQKDSDGSYHVRNLIDVVTRFPNPNWRTAPAQHPTQEDTKKLIADAYKLLTKYDEKLVYNSDPRESGRIELERREIQEQIKTLEARLS